MNEKIKAFAIGVAVIAFLTLFILGIASGGFLAWVLIVLALIFASYIIGDAILDIYNGNKYLKEL